MNSFVRKDIDLGTGMNTIRSDEDDDDSDTTSSSSAESDNTSEDNDEDESNSPLDSKIEHGPFVNGGGITECTKDADTSILNREASVDYSKNVALTNWTGRCSIPYSEPVLVNAVSSTTKNFPEIKGVVNKFQSLVNPSQFISNPNLLFRSPLKRELPNEPMVFTSTPKKPCLEADQLKFKTDCEPIRHFKPISFSTPTKCYNSLSIPRTVVGMKPHSSSVSSSAMGNQNVTSSSTPGNFTLMMQTPESTNVVGSVQKPVFHNVVFKPVIKEQKPSVSQPSISKTAIESIFLGSTEILTTEILRKIFKMCPLDDRKNIRLVCRDWYDMCTIFEVEERICIPRFYNDHLTVVMSTLYKSKRRYFNFEFHALDFGKKPRITFWKTCGPKVVSMKLLDCNISSAAFINILKHCYNLQVLEFDFLRSRDLRNGIRLHSLRQTLTADSLNRSLRTLKIHSRIASPDDSSSYWLDWICQFFVLFPNVSNFSLGHNCWNKTYKDVPVGPIEMCDVLLRRNFVRTRMESIALNIFHNPALAWNHLSSVEGLTKITDVTVDFDRDINLELFSRFLLQQVNLRKVTLYSFKQRVLQEKLDIFVPLIVKKSSLREFNFSMCQTVIEWDYRWSALFNSSNVEALRITCLEIDFSSDVPDRYSLPISSKLVTLAIRVEIPYNVYIVAMLDSFQKLETLQLSHMSEEMMNALCNRQNALKSLTVNRTLSNVVCRLRKLVKLEIPETVTLEGDYFYNLKHLRVLRSSVLQSEEKDFVPTNYLNFGSIQSYKCFCPSLEVLWIDCVISRLFCGNTGKLFEFIDGLLDRMRGLKFLYLAHNVFMTYAYQPRLTENEVALIFNKYHSLSVFIYRDIFVKDVITNRIRKLERSLSDEDEMLKKYVKVKEEWDYQYKDLDPLTYF